MLKITHSPILGFLYHLYNSSKMLRFYAYVYSICIEIWYILACEASTNVLLKNMLFISLENEAQVLFFL